VTASQVFGALNMLGEPKRTGVWQIVNNADGEIWTVMPSPKTVGIDPTTGLPMGGFAGYAPKSPTRAARVFNLTPVLEDYSIEDVTTAIKGAWDLLNPESEPAMKFHKDTKLLILVGEPNELAAVTEVVRELTRNVEYKKQAAMAKNVPPQMSFQQRLNSIVNTNGEVKATGPKTPEPKNP
jgi:hypothetical protein